MNNVTHVGISYSTPMITERIIAGITATMVNAIPKKNEITTENSFFSSLIARYLMYGNRQPKTKLRIVPPVVAWSLPMMLERATLTKDRIAIQ